MELPLDRKGLLRKNPIDWIPLNFLWKSFNPKDPKTSEWFMKFSGKDKNLIVVGVAVAI